MSLSSLRSFSGAASLAFETTRSTLKAMAEAAVPPGGSDTPGERRQAAPAAGPASGPVDLEAVEPTPAEKRKAGVRKGINLDAYA